MTNHLENETSPYLKQHKNNPVEWYPWTDYALNLAREQDKPILLSIGYSACHWCHVMAHESFEDIETAKIMNEHFINIKVDREERPDLDKVYQQIHQLMNQQPGGWPLTVFLTPNKLVPFFSGTYFPKERKYGQLSFKEILKIVSEYYHKEKEKIEDHTQHIAQAIQILEQDLPKTDTINSLLPLAKKRWQAEFDPLHGGVGFAPKFPMPALLSAILYTSSNDPILNNLVLDTLLKMAKGGIYDQLGGGFFRYSVDEAWQIPHFEKMLYDNAQLLTLYSMAYTLSKNTFLAQIIDETIQWLLKDMKAPTGGFYAAIDADSEGIEGKYYVWDPIEISQYLNQEQFAIFSSTFGLDDSPNFEGKWHLVYKKDLSPPSALTEIKEKLKNIRNKRIKPATDDKILCSWNALMLKGLCSAFLALNDQNYFTQASQLFNDIKDKLFQENYLWVTKNLKQKGFLDDYAFVLDACWYYLQINFDKNVLEFADLIAKQLINQFWDDEKAQFYFTATHHEKVIYRPRILNDDVLPAGAAISIVALQRFASLLNNLTYYEIAEKALKTVQIQIEKNPHFYPNMMVAQFDFCSPPTIVTINGKKEMVKEAMGMFSKDPNLRRFIFVEETKQNFSVSICQGFICKETINTLEALHDYLKEEYSRTL